MKRFLKWVLIVLAGLYVIGCFGLYLSQDKIIFRPTEIPAGTKFRFGQEINIQVADQIYLHGLYKEVANPKGVVLYLHGNRGNARRCQRQAEMFDGYGYNVLLLDYRGYGKSDGKVTSGKQLYADVQKVYEFLKQDFDESKIVIVGYSLGTGMASYLAANNQPKSLFLIAPYISIMDLKNRFAPFIPNFLIKYPLNNKAHLKELTCPVTILHGTEDEVIPYDSAKSLKETYPDKVDLITLVNTGHRGAIFHGAIRTALQKKI